MFKYIKTTTDGDYSTIYLCKELSDSITMTKQEIFHFVVEEQPKNLYINLENVSFIDDECVGLFLAVKNFAEKHNGTIMLKNALPSVYNVIKLAGLGYMIKQ